MGGEKVLMDELRMKSGDMVTSFNGSIEGQITPKQPKQPNPIPFKRRAIRRFVWEKFLYELLHIVIEAYY